MKMEIKHILIDDQRPPKETVKQSWPTAYDELDANPDADSHYIWVVACLLYPAKETTNIIEKAEELLSLCQSFRIPCEGDPFDRDEEYIINPMFPDIKGKRYISGLYAKLSRETVSKHLQDYRTWPLAEDVPLSKWWANQQSESLPKFIDPPLLISEEFRGHVHTNTPLRSDSGFEAMKTSFDAFVAEKNRIPKWFELIAYMVMQPPIGFNIDASSYKRGKVFEICIEGLENPIDREAFRKRYDRYFKKMNIKADNSRIISDSKDRTDIKK